MKRRFVFVLAAMLTFGGVQDAAAQKWLKTLGKVADAVLGDGNSSSSSSSSKTTASGRIPNVDFKVTKCQYWGNDVRISFVVTNTTSADLEVTFSSDSPKETYAFDGDNNKYRPFFFVGDAYPVASTTFATLPSNVPVKGFVTIEKVPKGCQTIKNVRFIGRSGNQNYVYTIGSQTVTYVKNTNADNIFSSMPKVSFDLNSCTRDGNDVVIDGTMTNTSSMDSDEIFREGSTVYDSEGNKYGVQSTFGGKEWNSFSSVKLMSGVPVRTQFRIKNVPASINLFSLIKLEYRAGSYGYYIELRNQKVD